MSESLAAQYLAPAEIEQVCERALKDVELQLVQARMNAAMHPEQKQLVEAATASARQLALLAAHCAALREANAGEEGP